jgi:hypothetical protein
VALDETAKLTSGTLDRAAWLTVRVEEIAADQHQVDLLGKREVDGPLECVELTLALCGRGRAKVVVARSKMNVGHVQQARHRD